MPKPPILIVDDDTDQITLLASMLSSAPNPVITALNGHQALDLLHRETPALVIVDMVLPDISGSQLVHTIRANPQSQGMKIIIITSFMKYVSLSDHELADKVFVKPVSGTELQQAVQQLLGY